MSNISPPIYNGRYELSHQIARGGTAQVYLARDLLLDRPVALKMLFPELSADRSFVDRFRREAQAAANLSHPNIVPVFDWGESDRTYYIVMEYVDGEPLSSIIRSQGPLAPNQAAGIATDIAKALSYAHRHGVVHRDIKPGNIMITADGQVKVGDFGIARAIGADENVTQTGLVMGTATYFSPEQAQGLGVDGRSDVYSLGVVLFEMVTGQPPFTGETPVSIAYQHVREIPPEPRTINPAVPVALEAIILHAMAKQPADRYASAQEFQSDLQRFVQGGPVLAQGAAADSLGAADTSAMTTTGTMADVAAGAGVGALGAAAAVAAGNALAEGAAAPPAGGTTTTAAATAAEVPEFPKRRTLEWTAAAVALILVIVGLAFYGGRQLGYFGGKPFFDVPDVVHQPLLSAEQTLQKDQLSWQVQQEANAASKGIVVSTSPGFPTEVQAGDMVMLTVSTGPNAGPVPNLIGKTEAKALSELKSRGFTAKPRVDSGPPPAGNNTPAGSVFNQSPLPAQTWSFAQPVTIYVATGKAQVQIPNLSGKTVTQATTILDGLNLIVSPTTVPQPSNTVQRGQVTGTSPPAGRFEPVGTTITLYISEPEIPVPDVINDPVSVAKSALYTAGFNPVPQSEPVCDPSEVNIVLSTNPVPTTPEPQGSNVTIFVGVRGSTCPSTTTTTTPASTTTTTSGTTTTTTGPTTTTKPKH